ncbi:MAG TPA: phosphoribosylanthranilate isomerase [Acidimicrobiales bacterium]|nr:phosphoribosylanthranilate isomerase [Acidimicrobiales bacterium]
MFVKICGVTNEEDALLAVAMGADAIGFVLAPSPRQVAIGAARDIARRLPPEVITVGVFRDTLAQRVVDVVCQAGLRAAQLNGHESPEDVAYIAERVPLVIKAFGATPAALTDVSEYRADAVLVDAPAPGPGKVFDWRLAERMPRSHRLILGGGLDPGNVADAIRRLRPWGVDVSTGVETGARKDPRKVRTFLAEAHAALPVEEGRRAKAPYDWQEEW